MQAAAHLSFQHMDRQLESGNTTVIRVWEGHQGAIQHGSADATSRRCIVSTATCQCDPTSL